MTHEPQTFVAHSLVHHQVLLDPTTGPHAMAHALSDLARVLHDHAEELAGADWSTVTLRLHTRAEVNGERITALGEPDTDLLRLEVQA